MKSFAFPSNQLMKYVMTGKFVAPSAHWKHEKVPLTEYELFVMTEGTLYLTYDKESFTLTSGQYLLLPPGKSSRQGFRSSYCAFYWLHFSVPLQTASDKNEVPFLLPQTGNLPKPEKMAVLMKQLQDSVKNCYPALAIDAMTTCVITELYGQLYRQLPRDNLSHSQKQIYSDIVDYIQLHIAENIRVSDIASRFGYNAKYLSHIFCKITGATLKQFVLNQKIDSANFMLTDTNKSIADIAQSLGFDDSHNFSRAYKRVMGLSPSEYRNAFAKRLLNHK